MKKISILLTFLFLNIFSQNAFSQKKDALYEKLDLFGDILETINNEYFKQINEGEVIDGAINGMLQSLDPYSSYMSPKTFKNGEKFVYAVQSYLCVSLLKNCMSNQTVVAHLSLVYLQSISKPRTKE